MGSLKTTEEFLLRSWEKLFWVDEKFNVFEINIDRGGCEDKRPPDLGMTWEDYTLKFNFDVNI